MVGIAQVGSAILACVQH